MYLPLWYVLPLEIYRCSLGIIYQQYLTYLIQIQIQNSLLLPIYIVLMIYDDMDTMYMYFSGTIS